MDYVNLCKVRMIDANKLRGKILNLFSCFVIKTQATDEFKQEVIMAIDNEPTVNPSKALEEIIKYMKGDTVTYRDVTDDIIIQILKDNGLWEDN